MSSRKTAPRIMIAISILMIIVGVAGFVGSLVYDAFFDEYDAYGEVPIPGSQTLHLPAGEVMITFHTVLVGGSSGSGLTIPPLGLSINPASGGVEPTVTENYGGSTTVNNDARRRVWVAQIPAEGDYLVRTEGTVSAFLDPRLAFGKAGSAGALVWIFVGLFVLGVLDLLGSVFWSLRVNRRNVPEVGPGESMDVDLAEPMDVDDSTWSQELADEPASSYPQPYPRTSGSYTPTDDGVRIEQLKTLAALRDSGALTQKEFEAEKRRVLDGR